MLTNFLSTENYKALSASYTFDNQLDYKNYLVGIEGNMSVVLSPVFLELNDFTNNNYSFLYLTKKQNLATITDFSTPTNKEKNIFCTIYNTTGTVNDYLSFTTRAINNPTSVLIFDQRMTGALSAINDNNFFELDVTDSKYATISHLYNNQKFYLAYNIADLSLSFVAASAFTATLEPTKKFIYSLDKDNNVLTLQTLIRGFAYVVNKNLNTSKLVLSAITDISFNSARKYFNIDFFKAPAAPEVTNDWGSYVQTYNQNNLNINTSRSYFGIDNNFLLHSEYYNLRETSLRTNILTLKNQLNIKNSQGRQNVFLNENETFFRNYNTIFSGRKQEKGHEKLHLQYDSYSTPYTFKQGKTTWFHTPQNMFPYSRLNIKSSRLVKAGAVAGDHPLRSDKVFKKIANYKGTSNQGNATGEQTGQWLCSWLSGGNNINTEPVWVDRFYNPTTTTPYQAISAVPGNVGYTTSFECFDLPYGVVDKPSSLTFEPGCWYAYSRIGQSDASAGVLSIAPFLQQKNFEGYAIWNGTQLDPYVDGDGFETYKFDGKSYAYFDTDKFNLDRNVFTICFWANSEDWTKPKGYEIGGNYNDYGLGIFNYHTVSPLIFYTKNGSIISLNDDLQQINTYDTGVSAYGDIEYILRREPLNSFHTITNRKLVVEYDMREAIIDYTAALSASSNILSVTNDEARGYILYQNRSLSAIDLVSNLTYPVSVNYVFGQRSNVKEVARLLNGEIALIEGTNSVVRGNSLYFLSAGIIHSFSTDTQKLCACIGERGAFSSFNIDKNNNIWAADRNYIAVYGEYQNLLFTTTLTAASAITREDVNIKNICLLDNFYSGDLSSSILVTASGTDTTKAIIFKLNYDGDILKTVALDTGGSFNPINIPSNSNYNYSYVLYRYTNEDYTFKIRLYNQLNNEDVEIPSITVDSQDLDTGYHHFAIVLNTVEGYLKTYLDGELYRTTQFTPKKYAFTPLVTDRIFAGATPFYNGGLLSELLDKRKNAATSYFAKNLDVQNLYFYNTELNYYDIGMHYKQKNYPKDLTWDVPSGRRNFIDVASRYFKQKVPGAKSGLYNVYINDNILDSQSKDKLSVAIVNRLKTIMPGYSKLNALKWVTTIPSQSANYVQPFFPGNTLTNGAVKGLTNE